jgi:hypothetical protein
MISLFSANFRVLVRISENIQRGKMDSENREQQMQELEALESIYAPEELQIHSRDYPNLTLTVRLTVPLSGGASVYF